MPVVGWIIQGLPRDLSGHVAQQLAGAAAWPVQAIRLPVATKEKAERWTRWRAFAQVRHGSNIQLLLFSLVTFVEVAFNSPTSGAILVSK